MRRRFFLKAAAITLLSQLLMLGRTWSSWNRDDPAEVLANRIVRILSDPRGAGELGLRYLESRPEESERRHLVDMLLSESAELSHSGDAKSIRRALSSRRERDFREEDVVVVDGWVLARSEARICALASLMCETA